MKNFRFIKLLGLSLLMYFSVMGVNFGQGSISGTVTDEDGIPLIGASVYVQNTSTGTITDMDGKYQFNLDEGKHVIIASYIGNATQSQEVTVVNGQNVVADFVLGQDNMSLDEVVVTGTFGSRSQKESPISMTYLNSAQIEALATNSQADILRTVPGITAEGGGGEVASNIFVRGLPSGGQYQFTPLEVDGMPVLSTFGLNSSAHDVYFRTDMGIRNLEFIRGGSSTLFGAGSVAGIINYTSVVGSETPKSKVAYEWGNGGRSKMDFVTSGPAAKNLFYAVSGFYRYDDGPLETGLPTRGYQLRGNLRKLFNDGKSSFTFYTQYIDDNVQFYLPYPLDNSGAKPVRPIGNDGEEIFTLLTSQATDFSFDTPNGVFETPISNGVITKGGFAMFDLNHSFGNDWRLHTKVKAAKYDHWFNLFLDGDGAHNTPESQSDYLADRSLPTNATFVYTDSGQKMKITDLLFENRVLDRQRPMEEMVGELNLTKSYNGHNITVGTFMSDTKAEDNNWIWSYLGDFSNSPRMVSLTYTDSLNNEVDYTSGGYINGSGRQTSNKVLQSIKTAVYAADEMTFDQWVVDLGVRWERAAGILSLEKGVGSNNFNKGTVSASDFAVAGGVLYKMNTTTNLYANLSKGYFFPELRGVKFSSPGNPQTYKTEGVMQGELGAKVGNSKLSATGALFFVALSDRRSVDFVNDGQGGVKEEVQVQSTQTMGLETSLSYKIAKWLTGYGNFTYQDHKFTKVERKPEQVGNKLKRQPNVLGMVGINYDQRGIDFDLSANFSGKKFANDANTVELDGYNIVRMAAGYKIGLGDKQSLRLGFSVFNLLNTVGVTEGSPRQGNSQVAGGDYFVGRPILPRRVFLNARFEF
ncbi:MAG TPA: TonB-dependent receptor [Saprospiraceae bacterium]|nr:TonB-dependent receptor [Saprospiraceae bacterium]